LGPNRGKKTGHKAWKGARNRNLSSSRRITSSSRLFKSKTGGRGVGAKKMDWGGENITWVGPLALITQTKMPPGQGEKKRGGFPHGAPTGSKCPGQSGVKGVPWSKAGGGHGRRQDKGDKGGPDSAETTFHKQNKEQRS